MGKDIGMSLFLVDSIPSPQNINGTDVSSEPVNNISPNCLDATLALVWGIDGSTGGG